MKRTLPILLATLALAGNTFAAKMTIKNTDSANVGFNDNTPAAPVGGNTGTTLGQQRMNVFLRAAEIWGNALTSDVEIVVDASFAPNSDCTATQGVLAFAGPTRVFRDFKNAPLPGVWYPVALANKLAGTDLFTPAQDTNIGVKKLGADIRASFNSAVGTPNCLPSRPWYLGLDAKHGDATDLLPTVLHELTHGLGMTGTSDPDTGFLRDGYPNVTEIHTFDARLGRRWDQMTADERIKSQVNTGYLVWDGENTRGAAQDLLNVPTPILATGRGTNLNTVFDLGTADFGGKVTANWIGGSVVAATDAENADGPTSLDGCSPYSNASAVKGNIALVDRGGCTFALKAQNAQAAGATAIVIADNQVAGRVDTCAPPGMTGTVTDVTIPVVSIRFEDGKVVRGQLQGGQLNGSVRSDTLKPAGLTNGQVRLYAPCTFDGGSSVHHWDTTASPNLLMEPFISGDLKAGDIDLTLNFLRDIGWGSPATGRRVLHR